MKTFLLTATYLVGIGELILAIFFWVTHSKSEIRKVVALLALSTGMWVILSAFSAYKPDEGVATLANSFIFVFGVALMTALLHLVLLFPYPLVQLDRLHKFFLYFPAFLFSIIALFSDGLQIGATGDINTPGQVIPGPVYQIYNLFLLSIYLTVVYLLFYRQKRLDGMHKENNRILLLGIIIGGLPAVFLDLISPVFFPDLKANYLFGVLFTGFWLGVTAYIIAKK